MNTRITRGVLAVTAALVLSSGVCLGACEKPVPASTPRRTTLPDAPKRPVALGPKYVIKFDRPVTAGLKYRATSVGRVDSSSAMNGRPIGSQAMQMVYDYEAVITVRAVHSCGKPTKLEAKIVKLKTTKGGATSDLLPKDTVVVAEAVGDKEKFTVNGKLVSKAADRVLGFVISLYDGDPVTTDEVFGPGGPMRPGDTWKPNAEKLLAGLKRKFKKAALWPKPGDVNGNVTFVAAKKVNGLDILEVSSLIKINNIAPAMGTVRATAGSIEIGLSGWLPKDTKINTRDFHKMTMRMHVEGEIARGAKTYVFVLDYDQSETTTITPIR